MGQLDSGSRHVSAERRWGLLQATLVLQGQGGLYGRGHISATTGTTIRDIHDNAATAKAGNAYLLKIDVPACICHNNELEFTFSARRPSAPQRGAGLKVPPRCKPTSERGHLREPNTRQAKDDSGLAGVRSRTHEAVRTTNGVH